MLSIIIATLDSERALVPTLAALVPGAMSGIVSEVLVADGGSHDDTVVVAEIAGCNFMVLDRALAPRLKAAAVAARAPWLMFLRPGTVLYPPWTDEASRFVEQTPSASAAAVFRRGARAKQGLREGLTQFAAALGAWPRPEQGLLIGKALYDSLGGHSELAAEPESDLIRRLGRNRIVRLPSLAYSGP